MSKLMSRRQFGLLAGSAAAALGHRVHQTSATTGPGGDATEAWRKQGGNSLSWVTFGDTNAIHEHLLREVTLSETAIDVGYLLNGRAGPRNLTLFEPLDAQIKDTPIEDLADFRAIRIGACVDA